MKTKLTALLFVLFLSKISIAQIGISPTNTPPHASAMFDVSSTNKGLLIPRMTTAQRLAIASPANGLTVYDTNTLGFWFYNGAAWQNLLTVGNNLWLANGSDIFNSNAGNIGIGTNTPNAKMHIKLNNANALFKAETNNTANFAGVELKSDAGIYDVFEMKKWGPGASGNIAGVPLDGLSLLTTGASTTAGMYIGTIPAQPIYFSTDNKVRMQITPNGTIKIGNPTSLSTKISIGSSNSDTLSISAENHNLITAPYGNISSNIYAQTGAAIYGGSLTDFSTSFFETNRYGVIGTSGSSGISVGAFTIGGTGLRASVTSNVIGSKAIHSSGSLKFDGINEGLNKILTSDATGNATWQDASISSGWSKNGIGDIYNNPNNAVLIGSNMIQPSGSFYNNQIGLQVAKHTLFTGSFGGDPFVRIVNNPSDVPLGAGVALYVNNSVSTAAVFKSQYSGLEVESAAQNTLWSAGRFILNNLTSTANAFEISNNGTGYALTVNNIGAGSNASAYLSNSNIAYTVNSNIGVELNNSYLKVSGVARTMFSVTSTAPTITFNRVALNYPGMSQNDMLVVTHVYTNTYIGGVGVWWDGTAWTIFRQDQQAMPVNQTFNVLVVKQ